MQKLYPYLRTADSIVVAAPADAPPLTRMQGANYATAIAEHFRDRGQHVLLLMDSLTRYAMAQREIALAIGEPPATKGYPPSVFALLPRILERAGTDERLRGMGTTLVCAHFDEAVESVIIAHVGDSRAYLVRQGAIRQLTEDHSLLNDYLRTRQLTPEEIENFPHKNVIVRALGMKEQVEVDLLREPLRSGDVVLLCCDGLSGMLPDQQIAELVWQHQRDLKAAAQALVDAANAAGGVDNITCVLAQLHD
jgi:hydrogenase maturation factor